MAVELTDQERQRFAEWLREKADSIEGTPFGGTLSVDMAAMRWKLREVATVVDGTHSLFEGPSCPSQSS